MSGWLSYLKRLGNVTLHPGIEAQGNIEYNTINDRSIIQRSTGAPKNELPYVMVLGVPVTLINLKAAVKTILNWVERGEGKYICVRDVHGLMTSHRDPRLMQIHRSAGMVTPDGMPLVWISKLRSRVSTGRVCGSDLVDALCNAGQATGLRHYFYGGKAGVAEAMVESLRLKYPNLSVAGLRSPPFRPLTEAEHADVVDAINNSGAQVVWVGLSTPKQEHWMREHVSRIKGATLIGVGDAFDFHSGAVARAPKLMQDSGLEWIHRLATNLAVYGTAISLSRPCLH